MASRVLLAARRSLPAAAAAAAATAACALHFAAGSPSVVACDAAATAPGAKHARVANDAAANAALHPNLVVVDSKAVRGLLTIMRDNNTMHLDFATAADRLMRILAEEALAEMPGVAPVTVTTPCGAYDGLRLPPPHTLAVVSIVRAGDTLLEAVRRVAPAVAIGKVLIQRDESTPDKVPRLFYSKLPADIALRTVLLVDPMLATGGSAEMAINELTRRGVPEASIVFANVVACPEGLARLARTHPGVKVVTTAIDERLNEHRYIVPGLGDYGDRYHATDESSMLRAR
jgi:uracil phosphoribosyltransferase